MSRLLVLPRALVRAALAAVVLGAVLFVGLTRTQVGRDALRDQIEGYVERELEGRLAIGQLTGNLVFDLFASDVRLYGPDGALVASVDSVVVRPKWLPLLRRELQIDEVYVVRPRVAMHRDSLGTWDLLAALQSKTPATEPPPPITVRSADIEIEDGLLVTSRDGDAPSFVTNGTLFDVTRMRVEQFDLRGALDWAPEAQRIEIERLAATVPALPFQIADAEATVAVDAEGLVVDGLRLVTRPSRTDGTRLSGYASLTSPPGQPLADTPMAERVLDLRLEADRIDLDELRRVVPASPLADAIALQVDAEGPLGDLDVRTLEVERGVSRIVLTGQGAVAGEALGGSLALARSTVRQADLVAVVPTLTPETLGIPDLDHLGPVRLRGDAEIASRTVEGGRQWDVDGDVTLTTRETGAVAGTVALALAPASTPVWNTDLQLDALDLGGVLQRTDLAGGVSGWVQLASLADSTEAALRVEAALAAVRVGAVRADTLAADLRIGGGRIAGRVFARESGGQLDATGSVAGFGSVLSYRLDAAVERLDARAIYAGAPRTDVTGRLRLAGRGTTLADLRATLDADLEGAQVAVGDSLRPIDTQRLALTIAPPDSLAPDAEPRLSLRSDIADVTLDGALGLADLVALGRHWGGAFARTVDAERRKSRMAPAAEPRPEIDAVEPDVAEVVSMPLRPVRLTAALHDPEALRPFVPGLPALARDAVLTLSGQAGTDSLALGLAARDDTLATGALATEGLAVRASLRSRYGPTLLDRSIVTLNAQADSLRLGGQMLATPTLVLDLVNGEGAVRLDARPLYNAAARREPDSLVLGDATIAFGVQTRPEAARVTFQEAYVRAGALHWALAGAPTVDLYTDALVTDGLTLARMNTNAFAAPQQLILSGAFSPARTDTAYVAARGLDLAEVLRVVGLSRPFGGQLDGDVAIPAAFGQPELEGDLRIAPFLFDGRPAGEIAIASRFRPGTTDLGVDLRLSPNPDGLAAPDERRLPANDFDIAGTLRLPGRADDGTRTRGAYDLDVDFRRLDLFFFDWLFPRILDRADGVATGTARITGTLTRPLFEADLAIRDGRFRVPGFNLALGIDGEVDVDPEGIHVREALLSDRTGGSGRVQGSILFNDYRFWSFDLAGALREMQIIDVAESDALPFYGDIRASGALTLTGPVDNVFLQSENARTTPDSELFIPVTADAPTTDTSFLVFADSTGQVPEAETRRSLVSRRPTTERSFLDGLEMQLNVQAPSGSTVHLVLDPATGDVIDAVGRGRLELTIDQGRFFTFGTFDVEGGDYVFTAGDVFTRRFRLVPGGTLRWTGDPIDARLDLAAAYETRASLAGLSLRGVEDAAQQRVPLIVTTQLTGTVTAPLVDLRLDLDTGERLDSGVTEALRTELNRRDQQAEYATSVLLTNSFLLAPSDDFGTVGETADELLYTSLSQLVSTRLNQFLNEALASENVEVLFGVQQGSDFEAIDLTYGVALRFLDERLIIRGEGLYQRDNSETVQSDDFQGEVAVEVKLTPDVSLEVFYRRENELLIGEAVGGTTFGAYGAGLSYQTEFASWPSLLSGLLGASGPVAPEVENATTTQ